MRPEPHVWRLRVGKGVWQITDLVRLQPVRRLPVELGVLPQERQRRVADSCTDAEGPQQWAVREHSAAAEGALDKRRAVFTDERMALDRVQVSDRLIEGVIVNLAEGSRRDGGIPSTAVALAEVLVG